MRLSRKIFCFSLILATFSILFLVGRQWFYYRTTHTTSSFKPFCTLQRQKPQDSPQKPVISVTSTKTLSQTSSSSNILTKTIKTLDDIKNLQQNRFAGFGNGSIPRIVHVTYKSHNLPSQYDDYLRHCLAINPDVAFLFWTDAHAEEFVKRSSHNASEEESKLHKKLSTYSGLEKADVFRNMLLYYIGGIYMDLDMECKVPFKLTMLQLSEEMQKMYPNITDSHEISCMLDQEQWMQTRIRWLKKFCAMNNFMICRPKHPFFWHVLSTLKEDDKGGDIMSKTGPFLLTQRFEEYQRIVETSLQSDNKTNYANKMVALANPDWFSPIVDYFGMYADKCGSASTTNPWFKQGCTVDLPHYNKTLPERTKNAFLIHRFLHLGYSFSAKLLKTFVSITSFPGVYVVSLL